MLTSPNDRRDPSFVELSTVPTSCFWIDSDTFFVDVESGGPPGLTDKAVKFEPIKKILYDKPTQDAIRQLDGRGPEHVLEAIFLLSLKHLSFERSSQLTEWADAAAEAINTTGQHCVEISLFMATPAGLQVYEKVPLETALLRAGRSFAASWKLQACRPRVHIISEPEAALASVWGEETWSQEENSDSAIMIIDCGGTTMDASTITKKELAQPYRIRQGPSKSIDSGLSKLVQWIVQSHSFEEEERRHVVRWVKDATASVGGAELDLCCGKNITPIWETMRRQQEEQVKTWASAYCNSVKDMYGEVTCVVTGGGTIDTLVDNVIRSSVRNVFPKMEFVKQVSSHKRSSDVLQGLQQYAMHFDSLRFTPCPVTILLEQHADANPDTSENSYVIVTNQNDPQGPHPILPYGQLSVGEPINWQIDWGNDVEETTIPFYAQRQRIKEPIIVSGLANASPSMIEKSELYEIARLTIKKRPDDAGSSTVMLRVYPNALGRTIHVVVQRFPSGSAIDYQMADERLLEHSALSTVEIIGGLDVHKVQGGANMTYLTLTMPKE
ncbi:hypothetical protein HBI64_245110 [Parastagonospora nodorum]|nr:hypothetical protein HBI64_245110 [Parastagonospora nodorum]